MKYIGCDFHPSFQVIAMMDKETGELVERRLLHTEEARKFYEGLSGRVLVGIEASGNTHWFESLLARCGHELWIGDAAAIARQEGRKQKHDRRSAALILRLMLENRFPRIWVPTVAERDLRQLLIHRQHLVRMRTRIKNQLQHIALNQGWQKKRKLWSEAGLELLRSLPLEPWTGTRRDTLLELLAELEEKIRPLDQAVEKQAYACEAARRLATHPGVGPVISLATVLTMGDVGRFADSRKWVSYLGLNPSEQSSGQRRRLGSISSKGTRFYDISWWKARLAPSAETKAWPECTPDSRPRSTTAWPRWRWPVSWRCGCTGWRAHRSPIQRWFARRGARVIPWPKSWPTV
jgi:transposase